MAKRSRHTVLCVAFTGIVFLLWIIARQLSPHQSSSDTDLHKKLAELDRRMAKTSQLLQDKDKEMTAHIHSLKGEKTDEVSDMLERLDDMEHNLLAAVEGGDTAVSAITIAHLFDGTGCTGHKLVFESDSAQPMVFRGKRPKSIRVEGSKFLDLYKDRAASTPDYWSSVGQIDGCVHMYEWPPLESAKFDAEEDPHQTLIERNENPVVQKYNCIYSAESSNYFAYQTYANYYGFLNSGQEGGSWTRLISSRSVDDLADKFPTFAARRHPYSWRYGPLNKADVMEKWFASPVAPKEDVIVVLDPDSWLTANIRSVVDKVKPGQAYAERAFFSGSSLVSKLWQQLCKGEECHAPLDHVAVPYFVHRDDLKKIVPLWKKYILLIAEIGDTEDPSMKAAAAAFHQNYAGVQVDWCKEMLAYVYAAAAVGVRHDISLKLQVRDIESAPNERNMGSIGMIHMGRAFFPEHGYDEGKHWWMTGAPDFNNWRSHGMQVWCKCNETAGVVMPWPLPPKIAFQSRITLSYLHNSVQTFGPIPKSIEFRDGPHMDYHRGQQ